MAPKDDKHPRQPRVKRGIRLSRSTEEYLLILGDGNLSLGIEKAVGQAPFTAQFLELLEARRHMGLENVGSRRRRAEG